MDSQGLAHLSPLTWKLRAVVPLYDCRLGLGEARAGWVAGQRVGPCPPSHTGPKGCHGLWQEVEGQRLTELHQVTWLCPCPRFRSYGTLSCTVALAAVPWPRHHLELELARGAGF